MSLTVSCIFLAQLVLIITSQDGILLKDVVKISFHLHISRPKYTVKTFITLKITNIQNLFVCGNILPTKSLN